MTSRRIHALGTITALTYPGAGSAPVFRATFETDDGVYVLAFLGRNTIECIEVGARLRVSGTVVTHRGVPSIYNPTYSVIPAFSEDTA